MVQLPFSSRLIRKLSLAIVLGGTVAAAANCGTDIGSTEQMSTDSFANPTEHGVLIFGSPHHGYMDEAHRFHAWNFTLSGEAEIELLTQIQTSNLDTVMYLYHRGSSEEDWGSYVAKNDDSGSLASRIAGTYGAGEYRIKIKASKIYMGGNFNVLGNCQGAGCPAPPGGECSTDNPSTMPGATGFGASCAAKLETVVLTPATSIFSTGVTYSTRCDQGAIVGRAVDFYHDYWDALMGWDEFTYEEDVSLEVSVSLHDGAGSVVRVATAWGDEDTVTFVFDGQEQLVAYYHDEQSPSAGWFCREPNEAAASEPEVECVGHAMSYGPHKAEAIHHEEGTGNLSDDEPMPDNYWLIPALQDFVSTYGLSESTTISFSLDYWGVQFDDHNAGRLELTAQGVTATYFVGDEDYGNYTHLFTRTDSSGTQFLCWSGAY